MLQPSTTDKVVHHFEGKLLKGEPRRVISDKTIDELRAAGVSMQAAWSMRFVVPVDIAEDCQQAISWITTRLMKLREAGFRTMEISGEMREVKLDRESKDPPRWEAYWSAMLVHPEGKDPRKLIKQVVNYNVNLSD